LDLGWLVYLWIIPVLGLLVFVHELGHFVTARLNGIRVEEFGFGFPPRLIGIKRGEVIYSINLIPVGGFVRIYGENGEDPNDPRSFSYKKPWQRAIVLAAGSLMNLFLAIIIFTLLAMTGLPVSKGAVIRQVADNSPAASAGLQPGDKIRSIDGISIDSPDDIARVIAGKQGQTVTIVVERDGRTISKQVTPRVNPPRGQGAIGIVIYPETVVTRKYNPIAAIGVGISHSFEVIATIVQGIGDLITGKVGIGGVMGPIGIADATGQIARQSALRGIAEWTALLSINLFLVNLLPLPALDGGRLIFVIIEAIRGKKISPNKEALVHAVGMMLLLALLAIISIFDVLRIAGGTAIP